MSAITERQWLPDPPAPWFWELHDDAWWLAHQDPDDGLVVAGTVKRWTIGDERMLELIRSTIANLPPAGIAKSDSA